MPCELVVDPGKSFPGTTLFPKLQTRCIKPTAVYFAAKHAIADDAALNVVLWLHGHFVKNDKHLFQSDPSKVREQVRDSGKDVVLIAPFLGWRRIDPDDPEGKKRIGPFSVAGLGGSAGLEKYFDEVLASMSAALSTATARRRFGIKTLVIACHSGGGSFMRELYGSLGSYRSRLKECWGFDCLYGADDAVFWHEKMLKGEAVPLYIFYGPSTLQQSVTLDLLGRGMIDKKGAEASPRAHPPMSKLHVSIGQSLAPARIDDLMFPPVGTGPQRNRQPPAKASFVERAIFNLRLRVVFDKGIHYAIAREGFLSRLKAADFL